MGKYRLDTSKTTTFTVVIEAESIEDAEKQVEHKRRFWSQTAQAGTGFAF
jgi:hypothetical protein